MAGEGLAIVTFFLVCVRVTNSFLYMVQSNDDDDVLVTKRHLKKLNEKLDKLMASSSTHDSLSESAIKDMMATLFK